MPLQIIRQDITKMKVDAIVNTTNEEMIGYSGVDYAVHTAAGPELDAECEKLAPLGLGQAKITAGYSLPCKYVIHTSGPIWQGGLVGEENILRSCYAACLRLAKQYKCRSVAFPLISSGVYGFPKDRVLRIAMDAIGEFLLEHEMRVYIVVYDREATAISRQLFADVQMFIDDHYVEKRRSYARLEYKQCRSSLDDEEECCFSLRMGVDGMQDSGKTIEDFLNLIDESFSEMLLRKIDESGMTDAECYKKANIDRKLFSKIRSDKDYRPSKNTVLAFAIALKLPLRETQDMLFKAGFALSHSNKFDIIVEYFIRQGQYDLFTINETLLAFDQKLLGM